MADWLHSSGEMAERIRDADWAATPLGARDAWPPELRTAVNLLLANRFPCAILWGKELLLLYNDAYRDLAGGKHPHALGRSTRDIWPEVWPINEPIFAAVLGRGETVFLENRLFPIRRLGFLEEAYFTLSYGPIRLEDGTTGGCLVTMAETTGQVIARRRFQLQSELLAGVFGAMTADEVLLQAGAVLARDPADLPFVLLYRTEPDGQSATLAFRAGLPEEPAASPHVIGLEADDAGPWPLARALRERQPVLVTDLTALAPLLPRTDWPELTRSVLVMPLAIPSGPCHGFLVAGVGAGLPADENSTAFVRLIGNRLAHACSVAANLQQEQAGARSDLRRKDEQLRAESERLKLVLEAADAGMWEWNSETGEASWTDKLWELFGIAPHSQPMTYATWRRIVWPEDLAQAEQVLADATRRSVEFAYEFRVAKPDGTLRSLLSRGRPVLGADGRPAGLYIGIMIDLTERKRAENELRAAEEQASARAEELGAVMDAMPSLTFIAHDPECRSMTSSRAALELLRLAPRANSSLSAPAEERPTTFRTFRSGRELRAEELPVQCAASTGRPILDVELDLVFSDGDRRTILGNAVPLLDKSGRPRGALGAFIDISERKRAEATLRESEEKYHRMVDTASEGIWLLDAEGKTTFANKHLEDMLGYEPNEMLGRPLLDFMDEPARLEAERHLDRRRQGIAETHDFRFRRRDGSDLWAIVSTNPILDDQGGFLGALGMITDISERKRSEAKLRESEERFKRMVHEAPLGIAIVDSLDAKFQLVNPALARITGRSQEELERIDWLSITHPDDIQPDQDRMAAMNAGKIAGFQLEKRYLHPDGHYLWVNITAAPMYVEDTSKPRHLLMVEDISARKRAEAALRKSEDLFRGIFSHNPLGIAVIDYASQRFLQANEAFLQIVAYPLDELRQMTPDDLTHPDDLAEEQRLNQSLRSGEIPIVAIDKRYLGKDGRIRLVRLVAAAIQAPDGTPTLAIGMVEDVTERRQMEERLRQSEKMASIGQLAGGIAHNFNNQLAGVMGYADLLLGKLDNETLRRYALGILKGSRRCADLAAQLLAFARKGKYLLTPVDVHQIIAESAAVLGQSLDKRIEIRQHLDAGSATVKGDPSQLQNLLLNLGLNARDAMPSGGQLFFETATVELAEEQAGPLGVGPGRYLQVSVRDTGIGMSPETQKHLFEPFFTTKEPGQGTGLGLASVHGTVVSHGGAITVQTELGQGSTFTVVLPLDEAAALAASVPEAAVRAGGPARVLLVDDENIIVELGTDMLQDLGYEVVACRDGVEAVARYREDWPQIDLVILDVVMPKLGGRDAFAAMRKINPALKVLVSSGYSLDGEAREILDDGALGFLQKPFNQAELARKVAEALGRAG